MKRERSLSKHVERELKSVCVLSHPHVIRFRNLFLTKTHLGIVFELAEGGDLYSYVACAFPAPHARGPGCSLLGALMQAVCRSKRGLSETEARWLFQQLIIAVHYCHGMGVVNRRVPRCAPYGATAERPAHEVLAHRDIKLENLLLDASKKLLKLTDWGFAKRDLDSLCRSHVGTPDYAGDLLKLCIEDPQ